MRALSFVLVALVALAGCDSSSPEVLFGDAIDPTNPDRCLDGALSVEDLVLTDAQAASPASVVTVAYVGTLQFQSGETRTFDESANARFSLGAVVPGFRQGIGGRAATDDLPAIDPMRIGERRVLTIPPGLGYGYAGRYNNAGDHIIPRCATLTFDVTLLDL